MCQALPARVVRVEGDRAWVEGCAAGISLFGLDRVAVGDYILHHAGLALSRVEPEEAEAIMEAFRELDALYEEEDRQVPRGALGGGAART